MTHGSLTIPERNLRNVCTVLTRKPRKLKIFRRENETLLSKPDQTNHTMFHTYTIPYQWSKYRDRQRFSTRRQIHTHVAAPLFAPWNVRSAHAQIYRRRDLTARCTTINPSRRELRIGRVSEWDRQAEWKTIPHESSKWTLAACQLPRFLVYCFTEGERKLRGSM